MNTTSMITNYMHKQSKRLNKDLLERSAKIKPEKVKLVKTKPVSKSKILRCKHQVDAAILKRKDQFKVLLDGYVNRIGESIKADTDVSLIREYVKDMVTPKKPVKVTKEDVNPKTARMLGLVFYGSIIYYLCASLFV